MAAVQPRVSPRRHHQPPAPVVVVPPLPAAPSQAPAARPQLLPCKRSRSDAVAAVAHHGRKERVAESCCPPRLDQLEPPELVVLDDDSGEEDDGCDSEGSCVDGAGGGQEEEEESGSRGVALWSQDQGSGVGGRRRRCSPWASGSSRTAEGGQLRADGESGDEDPSVAAARRREEDRKFWEACLSSGYP